MCAMAATASTPALGGAWARSARLSHRVQERSQRRGHVWMCRSTVDQKTISVEDLPLPEGRLGFPVIGESVGLFRDPDFLIKRIKKYGPIFKSNVFGEPAILVNGVDNIRKVMKSSPPVVHSFQVVTVSAILGEHSLAANDGPEHALARRIVGGAFTSSAVSEYVPSIVERVKEYLTKWAENESVLLVKEARAFAFGITTQCVVGIEPEDYTDSELLDLFNTMRDAILSLGVNLPFTKFGKGLNARKKLIGVISKCVAELKRADSDKRALPLMAKAQEEGQSLTIEQLCGVILNILVAGYDTTAFSLEILMLELAKNPKILQNVRNEQAEVVSKFGPLITPKALAAMPLTEACIKETMRVKPPAGFLFRKASKDFEVGGYRVPEGWQVICAIGASSLYCDERWPDDTRFNPDRFLTEAGMENGGYIPFGMGSHFCVGNILAVVTLKIMLSILARDFDFEVENVNPKLSIFPVSEPLDGLPIKFTQRTN